MIKRIKGKRPVSTDAGREPTPKENALSGASVPTRMNARRKNAQSLSRYERYTQYLPNSRYYELTCGHFGCREINELYHAWRMSRNLHYCEVCDKWNPVVKKRKVEYPDEPMF